MVISFSGQTELQYEFEGHKLACLANLNFHNLSILFSVVVRAFDPVFFIDYIKDNLPFRLTREKYLKYVVCRIIVWSSAKW